MTPPRPHLAFAAALLSSAAALAATGGSAVTLSQSGYFLDS